MGGKGLSVTISDLRGYCNPYWVNKMWICLELCEKQEEETSILIVILHLETCPFQDSFT